MIGSRKILRNSDERRSTADQWDAETQRRREVLRDEINQLTFAIIGAAIEVHRTLGPGYLEKIYDEALAIELRLRGHTVDRQQRIPIEYKGVLLAEHVLDMVVDGEIVLEIKAVEDIHRVHCAQLHSYLTAGAFELGLLINFNVPVLKDGVKRVILTSAAGAD
ncbi:MAG: GxxExxY protein [Myxococcota bacterium]|nr:GxxExxY protein [Myxococcota bacterium]